MYFHFSLLLHQTHTQHLVPMAESSLQRLLALGASLPDVSLRNEQRELVHKLAQELHVPLVVLRDVEPSEAAPEHKKKPHVREEITSGASSAREKFQRQEKQQQKEQKQAATLPRKTARNGTLRSAPPASNGAGNSDCDISSPEIKSAYDQVRDDSSPISWIALGYGSSKKALELRGSGEGGLQGFTAGLKDDETTYGYVRVIFGDSQRSKFVFVTYVPETLSTITKARANTHKPTISQYLKYMHIEHTANNLAELEEDVIQAKLAAAAGANYGTGGTAAAGSEDFGSIKDNAKNFFQQTESQGNRQSIVYHKGPLAETTPVALQGRAGITEKYIKA